MKLGLHVYYSGATREGGWGLGTKLVVVLLAVVAVTGSSAAVVVK